MFLIFCSFLFYGPEDGSKRGLTAPPRSNSMSSSGPLTFDSGLNSVSPNSHSVSESHLSSSQTQSKPNGDSGVNMSPPPINLKTHPSLRRRSNEGSSGSVGRTIQRSVSQDTSHSSQTDDDLQFSCGRETPSPNSDKSGSDEQLDGFRPRAQQLSDPKEQYEVMRHPTKPRTESAPPAPVGASNYVRMSPLGNGRPISDSTTVLPTSNYVNHVIPADMKAPVENYENTGFNAMRVPPIPVKGTAENLATIQEGTTLGSYENHSLPDTTYVNNSIKPVPSDQYENTSPNSSPPSAAAPVNNYQNIHLDPSASPRMNTHERVVLKKTERKNSVKDHSGNLQYSEIDNGTTTSSRSPPKIQRQYSDVDCDATMAVEAQQRQRTMQKEHTQQMKVH